MNAIKTLKLYKYAPQAKSYLICVIALLAFSVWGFSDISLMEGNTNDSPFLFQYFFLSFIAIPIIQLCQSLMLFSYVRTSPKLRKTLIYGSAELLVITELILYTISITGRYLLLRIFHYSTITIAVGVLTFLFMLLALIFYGTLLYKKRLIATILYVIYFGTFYFLMGATTDDGAAHFLALFENVNPIAMILVGYAGIILCTLCYLLIIRLTYRLPYSERIINQIHRYAK